MLGIDPYLTVYLYFIPMDDFFGTPEPIINSPTSVIENVFGQRLPWQYKWAPKTHKDMILPEGVVTQIEYQIATGGLKNMTFHGGTGVGKTTLARLLPSEVNSPFRFYSTSQMKSSTISEEIVPLGRYHMSGPPTIIVLDEIEKAGSQAFWNDLISAIDSNMESLRFICTANYLHKIPEPLLSRCPPISFAHSDPKIKIPIFDRLKEIAKIETDLVGGTYDAKTLAIIAKRRYPDIRLMINDMELTFDRNKGSIIGTPVLGNEDTLNVLHEHIQRGKIQEARLFFGENVTDFSAFFSDFCDFSMSKCEKGHRIDVAYSFAEYDFRASANVNQEMNITRGLFAALARIYRG